MSAPSVPPSQVLIVTDLDGTLLDHYNYSFDSVLPVLKKLREVGIPVVVNTSKTRREWHAMREQFQNEDAFVIENGSALYLPDGKTHTFGSDHAHILSKLAQFKSDFRFRGFSELGLAGIMKHTGLRTEEVQRAATREFSEPLLWEDTPSQLHTFCKKIAQQGLKTLQGGRFLHILGQTDKAKPLSTLREYYQAKTIIALGDSANDLAMIEQADIGVLISSPTNPHLTAPNAKRLIRTELQGPQAWAATMTRLLDELSI